MPCCLSTLGNASSISTVGGAPGSFSSSSSFRLCGPSFFCPVTQYGHHDLYGQHVSPCFLLTSSDTAGGVVIGLFFTGSASVGASRGLGVRSPERVGQEELLGVGRPKVKGGGLGRDRGLGEREEPVVVERQAAVVGRDVFRRRSGPGRWAA